VSGATFKIVNIVVDLLDYQITKYKHKKAGLGLCSYLASLERFSPAYINKKRDCNLAVPLTQALVLPSIPNNNTEAHAVCTNARTMRVHYLHTNGHLSAAMFWVMNLPDSY
jgi:hypothetical protein